MRTPLNMQACQSTVEKRQLSGLLFRTMAFAVIMTSICIQGRAQDLFSAGGAIPAGGDLCDATNLAPCFHRIAQDEAGITRSIFHPKRSSILVILGVAAATGVALHFDRQMSQTLMSLPDHPAQINQGADIAGVYGPFAAGGLMYVTGSVLHNPRARETGVLATEAMVDGALIGQALKFAVNRQSPGTAPQAQQFYASGVPRGGSMPSAHAINVWAFARIVAGESNSKWVGVLAYSLATTVSFSRTVTGAHSVSDVIVGSAIGYGVGEYVLRRRGTELRGAHPRFASNRALPSSVSERDDALTSTMAIPHLGSLSDIVATRRQIEPEQASVSYSEVLIQSEQLRTLPMPQQTALSSEYEVDYPQTK